MLTVREVSKRFGPVQALRGVSVDFAAGEIHAVLGENGAGKSTLMNVLGGFIRPDSGVVELDGKPLPLGDPLACRSAGIEMVHQHFMLVPAFTVGENLALARLGKLSGSLDTGEAIRKALDIARGLGWQFDPATLTRDLPVGAQQRIEILKALAGDARILILDEPTAVLAPEEVVELFAVLRKLRDLGIAVVLIAHKLSEVLAVADRVTVLRRGERVAGAPAGEVDEVRLATWMVGELPAPHPDRHRDFGPVAVACVDLQVRGDRGELAVQGATFEIRKGEILGFGGVDGNGQVELAEALAKVRPIAGGEIRGTSDTIGYIPQDRQIAGLALEMSILDNCLIGGVDRRAMVAGPFLVPPRARSWAATLVERFRIKVGSLSDPVASLSGGNQQKVVVARTLDDRPEFIVAVNPTRGLDIQATNQVHQALLGAAEAGSAVALISTDLDELAELADRTLFLSKGRLASTFEQALKGEVS